MENEQIDPKEKEKILRDLQWWLYDLEERNDIDMLYHLIDMKTDWEDEMEENNPEEETE